LGGLGDYSVKDLNPHPTCAAVLLIPEGEDWDEGFLKVTSP